MESVIFDISRRLTYLRKLRKLTQGQLAEKANIATRTYQRIESAETAMDMKQLFQLSEALSVHPTEVIVEEKDDKEEYFYDESIHNRSIYELFDKNLLCEKLEALFQNLDEEKITKSGLAYSVENLSKIYLSPKYLDSEKGLHLELGSITKNDISLIKYWEDICNASSKTKYHLGFVQAEVEGHGLRTSLCLAKATSTKFYNPSSISLHIMLPDNVKVSIEQVIEISKFLGEKVKEYIHAHGHIG
ncbi:MAG: helix-turn-helix domain-containing protein [Bacteriovoracaceae bacterium]|nr:helix-turn-helix domain-containing protein [Bacteriovoracaceae bacterium]